MPAARAPGTPATCTGQRFATRPSGTGTASPTPRATCLTRHGLLGLLWLLDFFEDLGEGLHLLAQVVDAHTDLAQLQVGVLLRGDRHVGETPELLGQLAVVIAAGDLDCPAASHGH